MARDGRRALSPVHRATRACLEACELLPGGRLVVAVSGGPDSLALLYALHHLRDELGLELHGAHLDHGLRGQASRGDAEFVAATLRRLGVPHTVTRADVAAYRRQHRLSPEEGARAARYAFLARVAVEQGAAAVALGHTADDQAETVLMNIARGAGLTGLRGMAPVARRAIEGSEVLLLRPLLRVTRAQTEAYCEAVGLRPARDASNLSTVPWRNRVRLELLPWLERHQPGVRRALLRLAEAAARDLDYIEGAVADVWALVARIEGARVLLDRAAVVQVPPAVRYHLLRRAVRAAKGDLEDVEMNHIEGMDRLLRGGTGKALDLPSSLRFEVSYATATLGPVTPPGGEAPRLEGDRALLVPGETRLPGWTVWARVIEGPPEDRGDEAGRRGPADSLAARLDADAVAGPLSVRGRLPGDRFQPLSMPQPKKLQDFFVDAKVTRPARDAVPLVVCPKGIAWVVGWRVAQWARVTAQTHRTLELRFNRR